MIDLEQWMSAINYEIVEGWNPGWKTFGDYTHAYSATKSNSNNSELKNKILKGGAGSWGVVPMPANTKLSDADVSLLTNWILRGAPSAN